MLTPEKIKEDLLRIIEGIRNPPPIMNFSPLLPYTRRRFDNLIMQCLELHKKIVELPSGADTCMHSQVLFSIEAEYKQIRARLLLMPAIIFLYSGFFGLVLVIRHFDVAGFVKSVFKVDAPERLITFGVAGAFLYLATSLLAERNQDGSIKDSATRFADFTVRILLAVIVPIVLVSLFFTTDGKVNEMKLTPELLAFGCGYSAKLVVDLFNKVVDKASKMIDAL